MNTTGSKPSACFPSGLAGVCQKKPEEKQQLRAVFLGHLGSKDKKLDILKKTFFYDDFIRKRSPN